MRLRTRKVARLLMAVSVVCFAVAVITSRLDQKCLKSDGIDFCEVPVKVEPWWAITDGLLWASYVLFPASVVVFVAATFKRRESEKDEQASGSP